MSAMVGQGQGRVVFEGKLDSRALGGTRMVRVYLPPSYDREPGRRYPVLYVQDGQNAFTTVGTNVAFGWGNWQLDQTVTELARAKKMREIILVAIDASPQRYVEYRGLARPSTERELSGPKRRSPAPGDNRPFEAYSRFLLEELKPKVDREYRTLPDPAHTGLLGSSLGGICSLTLAWQHPEVFGLAASLSGAFQVEDRYFLEGVLRPYRGKPKPFAVYLDSGVVDFSGGDDGRKNTEAVARALRGIGWRDGTNLAYFLDAQPLTEPQLAKANLRPDKWKEAQASQHNEFYWRLRAWRALVFLFPPD